MQLWPALIYLKCVARLRKNTASAPPLCDVTLYTVLGATFFLSRPLWPQRTFTGFHYFETYTKITVLFADLNRRISGVIYQAGKFF
jgi:hypothetical protein